jgi:hypothetical protein
MKILTRKQVLEIDEETIKQRDRVNDLRAECSRRDVEAAALREEVEKRDAVVEKLERELGQARMAAGFRTLAVVPDQVMANALKLVDEENALWRTVHSFIRMQGKVEQTSLCVPGLSNEAAQYNRGRLAMLEDLEAALVQVWVEQRVGK